MASLLLEKDYSIAQPFSCLPAAEKVKATYAADRKIEEKTVEPHHSIPKLTPECSSTQGVQKVVKSAGVNLTPKLQSETPWNAVVL